MTYNQHHRICEELTIAIRDALSIYVADHYSTAVAAHIVSSRASIAQGIAESLTEDFRLKRFAKIMQTRIKKRI